jgi:hypothetical protein
MTIKSIFFSGRFNEDSFLEHPDMTVKSNSKADEYLMSNKMN